MKKILIALLAVAGSYCIAVAQQPAVMVSDQAGWHKIGSTTVDFQRDRDEILVMGADRFASIKFKVTDAPIDLQDLEVYYESGDKQDIMVRTPLVVGTESRKIDLNGGERALKKIVFLYRTLPNRKDVKASVEVWGFKTNADEANRPMNDGDKNSNPALSDDEMKARDEKARIEADKNREVNNDMIRAEREKEAKANNPETSSSAAVVLNDSKGWRKIGEKTVDFQRDKDEVVLVGANRFAALKFKVTDAAIDLRDIVVYFDKGDKQDIMVRTPIQAGGESRSVDLKGGLERDISKIVFVYKTLPNRKETKAHVEIWGLKTNQVPNN